MADWIHEEEIRLPPAATGATEIFLACLDAMQEAAGRHAGRLGWGLETLMANGQTWVLARYHVRLLRLPSSGERIWVRTWPAGKRKLYGLRDFQIIDASGAELLRAASAFLLLNLKSRRPGRLDHLLPGYKPPAERAIADDFSAPLPKAESGDSPRSFRAQSADIDINEHVNNTVYLEWALSAAPAEIQSHRRLTVLEAAFLGEARLGDEALCHTQIQSAGSSTPDGDEDIILLQRLVDAGSGRELTRLRSRWR